MSRILVVDDDIQLLSAMNAVLRRRGHTVETASNGIEAASKLETMPFEAVITDLRMPGMDGLELLSHIRRTHPELPVVMLTAVDAVASAVEALRAGADDYLVKPFSLEQFDATLERLGYTDTAQARPRAEKAGFDANEIVTENAAMQALLDQAAQAAKTRATVLVEAESGTGKELLARWIHRNSANAKGPFVAINCAALPDSLLESELFGYEKGAFTGAVSFKPGKFEQAQNGTILLDEIGEMAPILQAKLLRVLQEQEVDRIGGKRPVPINARVIATTNKDLRKLIAKGLFREDLFFRLNVVPLRIPPLRERKDDIPSLTRHFALKYAGAANSAAIEPDSETLSLLGRYGWPGNVRELENLVHRAFALRGKLKIAPADLFDRPAVASAASGIEAGQSVSDMERRLIMTTLDQTDGNRTHAAKMLGISLRTLRNKLRDYKLEEVTV